MITEQDFFGRVRNLTETVLCAVGGETELEKSLFPHSDPISWSWLSLGSVTKKVLIC